jgi:hypothetical protein
MGYVIAGIIVLLIVAAGVTVFVLNATRRQRQASAADSEYGEGLPGTDTAIVAPDENTPLGDTDQHSGEQTEDGRTVGAREGEAQAHQRTGHAGEAEGGRRITPESEKLADRPR